MYQESIVNHWLYWKPTLSLVKTGWLSVLHCSFTDCHSDRWHCLQGLHCVRVYSSCDDSLGCDLLSWFILHVVAKFGWRLWVQSSQQSSMDCHCLTWMVTEIIHCVVILDPTLPPPVPSILLLCVNTYTHRRPMVGLWMGAALCFINLYLVKGNRDTAQCGHFPVTCLILNPNTSTANSN